MLVKNWVSMLYCVCYADFVSANPFQSDNYVYFALNNSTLTFLSGFIVIVFKL